MGKIKDRVKSWYRSIPLWLAIFLLASAALITASLASNRVTSAAKANLQYIMIQDRTPGDSGIVYETVTGERGETLFYKVDIDGMSPGDERLYRICRWVIQYAPVFLYSVSLLTAVLLLYFTKLKKPLAMLVNASEKSRRRISPSPSITPAGMRWRSCAGPLRGCAVPWTRTICA